MRDDATDLVRVHQLDLPQVVDVVRHDRVDLRQETHGGVVKEPGCDRRPLDEPARVSHPVGSAPPRRRATDPWRTYQTSGNEDLIRVCCG